MTHLTPTRRTAGALAALSAGVLLTLVGAGAASGTPDTAKERSGQAAIDFLGKRIDKAAKSAHMSVKQLEKTLRQDKSLKVDAAGQLLYVDGPEHTGTTTITDNVTSPLYATSSTFQLHSRGASPMKIYLDFTGHTTSGTRWNTNYTGGAAFSTPPFDRDGVPSSFSTLEHAIIQATWLSVREDFAQFNVDVTTQDPGYEGLRYSGTGDTAYGVRVVIGPNTFYPQSAGGVGYLDTFSVGDTPVYVFTNRSSGAKFIAEASSHETGHSFGLSHDGTASVSYYAGHANWAPIMGNSYSRAVTQWSRGEYAGANQKQDDLGLIARYTGWSADDYVNTTATTATLPAGTARYGTVNWAGDRDTFKFSLTGTRRLTINSWHNTGPVDPNLNARIVLSNSAGTVVATASPTGDLQAAMTVTLAAGTYYVTVDGVGEGSAFNTGWSAYASQGYYGIWLNWA